MSSEQQKDQWPLGSPKFDTRESWLHAAQSYGVPITLRIFAGIEQAVVGNAQIRGQGASIGEWDGTVGRLYPNYDCVHRVSNHGGRPRLFAGVVEDGGQNRLYLGVAEQGQEPEEVERVLVDCSQRGRKDMVVAHDDCKALCDMLLKSGIEAVWSRL